MLGSGRQQPTTQNTRTAPRSSQWYADAADDQVGMFSGGAAKREVFVQEVKRAQKTSFSCNYHYMNLHVYDYFTELTCLCTGAHIYTLKFL